MNTYISNLIVLLKRILLILFIYQICRILFYLFNKNAFNGINGLEFIGGIRFDLSAIIYTNLIIILAHVVPGKFKYSQVYQKIVKISFFLINTLFIATNFIDLEYYKFTGKRSSYSMITAKGMEQEFPGLMYSFAIEFWYIILIFIFLIVTFWKTIPNLKSELKPNNLTTKFIINQTTICILILGISLLLARGGAQEKPLSRVDSMNYSNTSNTAVVLNTPFCILKTLSRKEDLKIIKYYKEEELKSIFNPIITLKPDTTAITKKNVVILILESFGSENIGYSNINGKGYTPFLDSLIPKSYFFKNGFANGRLSIDAVPSIISSIPSLMDSNFIQSSFAFNKVNSLPKILKSKGYNTSFFHGAFNGSQNFDQYAKISGFENYYGKNEYPYSGGEDGRWGIFDEEFLQFFGEKLSSYNEPFFSTLFTISSHNPYIIPEKYSNKFPKGTAKIHESIGYTDYALRNFFNYAKKQNWYNNTLFIISADHTSSEGTGYYTTNLGKFSIPIILFDPSNKNLVGVNDKNFQQIDILPTILEYLNHSETILTYGKPLSENNRLVAFYQNNVYHFIKNNYYLIFNGKETLAFYDWKKDKMQKNNIKDIKKEDRLIIEKEAKAYIQSFNTRVVQNKLIPE